MTIAINTLEDNSCNKQIGALLDNEDNQIKIIETKDLDIHHCIGCNQCWLKTPGQCVIKDDYKSIIKQLVTAEDLWLVSDTRYGFLNYRGKRIMDRIMPMLNMNIEFRDGWMRHQLRYHALNIGVLYRGDGNQELLEEWCERCAKNLGGKSLGVIPLDKMGKEAASCM